MKPEVPSNPQLTLALAVISGVAVGVKVGNEMYVGNGP